MLDENYKRAVRNLAKLLEKYEDELDQEALEILAWNVLYLQSQIQYGEIPVLH